MSSNFRDIFEYYANQSIKNYINDIKPLATTFKKKDMNVVDIFPLIMACNVLNVNAIIIGGFRNDLVNAILTKYDIKVFPLDTYGSDEKDYDKISSQINTQINNITELKEKLTKEYDEKKVKKSKRFSIRGIGIVIKNDDLLIVNKLHKFYVRELKEYHVKFIYSLSSSTSTTTSPSSNENYIINVNDDWIKNQYTNPINAYLKSIKRKQPKSKSAFILQLTRNDTIYYRFIPNKYERYSVLQNALRGGYDKNVSLQSLPYPHIIIKNALPYELYNELEKQYPTDEHIFKNRGFGSYSTKGKTVESNRRYQINAIDTLIDDDGINVSSMWKDFVNYHVSKNFYMEIITLFEKDIRNLHPDMMKKYNNFKYNSFTTGIRKDPSIVRDVSLDCQISINSPVVDKPTSVVQYHLDNNYELYAGLYYFRQDGDECTGGDLEILEHKDLNNIKTLPIDTYGKQQFDRKDLNYINTVKYEKNTFVLFINSIKSIHRVSERSITPFSRRLVNIIAEIYTIPVFKTF